MKIYELGYNIFNSSRRTESCGTLILPYNCGKFWEINLWNCHLLHGLLWDGGKKWVKSSMSEKGSNFLPVYKIYDFKD